MSELPDGGVKKESMIASPKPPAPKPPLHPALNLEKWAQQVDLSKVTSRIAAEAKARGLNDAATIRRNPQALVTIIQQALGIEAAALINNFLKEE